MVRKAGVGQMTELTRLCRAELKKMHHTLLPALHIFLPILGIAVFLGYYSRTTGNDVEKLSGYIQALSLAYPLIISVVCALSVEQEERGHFQSMLGVAVHKMHPLLAKWLVLSGIGLGAVLLAVVGFAFGYSLMEGRMAVSWYSYLILALTLWGCSLNMYLLHLFLNLAFSKSISLCVGTIEALIAALFLTGLGEGIWQYFSCSWGGRWSGYLLLYLEGKMADMIVASMPVNAGIGIFITAVLWSIISLWYYYYEGRQCND